MISSVVVYESAGGHPWAHLRGRITRFPLAIRTIFHQNPFLTKNKIPQAGISPACGTNQQIRIPQFVKDLC
jgi:hypothetical protein